MPAGDTWVPESAQRRSECGIGGHLSPPAGRRGFRRYRPNSSVCQEEAHQSGQRAPRMCPPGRWERLCQGWERHRPLARTCASLLPPSRPTLTASARSDALPSPWHREQPLPPRLRPVLARPHTWLPLHGSVPAPFRQPAPPFQSPSPPGPSFHPKPSLPVPSLRGRAAPSLPRPPPITLLPTHSETHRTACCPHARQPRTPGPVLFSSLFLERSSFGAT